MSENYESMRTIPVENEELLKILNKALTIKTRDEKMFEKYFAKRGELDPNDNWVSDEYLHRIISMGKKHEGFPETMHGYEMRMNQREHQFFEKGVSGDPQEIEFRKSSMELLGESISEMTNWMGCRNNALNACYPPGGYISWHNNANAAAWNLIFTWSETGEGYFKYWDLEKKEVVYMHDKPGWSLKAGYFGHYGEPEKLFYHAAKTKCWRHTISFCFDRSELSRDVREDLLNEISSK